MEDEHALKVRDLARKFDEWEARNQVRLMSSPGD